MCDFGTKKSWVRRGNWYNGNDSWHEVCFGGGLGLESIAIKTAKLLNMRLCRNHEQETTSTVQHTFVVCNTPLLSTANLLEEQTTPMSNWQYNRKKLSITTKFMPIQIKPTSTIDSTTQNKTNVTYLASRAQPIKSFLLKH